MRLYGKLIGLLTACFVAFLIVSFPARAAFFFLAPAGVEAFGISGSAWQGKAKIVNVAGQQLRNFEWNLELPLLISGKIGGDVKTRWNDGFVEGWAAVSLGGSITLKDTIAGFSLQSVSAAVGTPELGGQGNVKITRMRIEDNWPLELIGKGEFRDLSSPMLGRGDASRIGSVAIEFDSTTEIDTNNLTGLIKDTDGFLELNGSLKLTKPSDYSLEVRIKARPDAPQSMQKNLQFLGTPEADGSRIFQLAGSI